MTIVAVIASAVAVVFGVLWWQYRERLYLALGRASGGPIETVQLDEFDPMFAHDERGPTRAAEVAFIGRGKGVLGGTSDVEAWIIAVLAKRAHRIFEFGTATGKSAYLMARNAPDDARIVTITLPPGELATYTTAAGDSRAGEKAARNESRFTEFLYTGSDAEARIEQLFGDTKRLDTTPYRGTCDLIFIDGSHTYSYVMSDTRKALDMLAPNGIVLWHDYRRRGRKTSDVFRALNELRKSVPLVHLAGTSLVAYRRHGEQRVEVPWRD
jgi:predicted O-methyltransferase YrrM